MLKYVRPRVEEEKENACACFLVGTRSGAHVALHALNEMRSEEVTKMVGLMPFLARKREIECAEVPRVVGEPTCGRARG